MTEFEILALGIGIYALIIGIILFFYFKFQYPKDKEKALLRKQQREEEYKKLFETEPEYIFKQAQVISMRKYVYHKSELAMPMLQQQVDEYYVTFRTEDGEEKEYLVSEALFFNVVKGEEGTLITVNGNFFDFGDGIDVVSDEEPIEEDFEEESTQE